MRESLGGRSGRAYFTDATLYDVETTFCRRWKCDFMSPISVGLNFSLSISKCRLNDDLIYY